MPFMGFEVPDIGNDISPGDDLFLVKVLNEWVFSLVGAAWG